MCGWWGAGIAHKRGGLAPEKVVASKHCLTATSLCPGAGLPLKPTIFSVTRTDATNVALEITPGSPARLTTGYRVSAVDPATGSAPMDGTYTATVITPTWNAGTQRHTISVAYTPDTASGYSGGIHKFQVSGGAGMMAQSFCRRATGQRA